MWHRVFCRLEARPSLESLLRAVGPNAATTLPTDGAGWQSASFTVGPGTPVFVERYLTDDDHLRDDLNTWAGWLETQGHSPNHVMLMERVVQTRHVVTVRKPVDHADEAAVDDLCRAICEVFARECDGVYQVDGVGWFDEGGQLLLTEY